MTRTENEHLHACMFDRAMALRDDGQLEQACELLEQLVRQAAPHDKTLSAHAHNQLGHIRKLQGRPSDSVRHLRDAVTVAPTFELASLGLFHALTNVGQHVDAMEEAVRFLWSCESLGYRELFSGGGFGDDVPDGERRLVHAARSLLATHREAQQARSEPIKGDTVRVRADAPEAARPGSLACVRGQRIAEASDEVLLERVPAGTVLFHIAFSDGDAIDLPGSLLDHADI